MIPLHVELSLGLLRSLVVYWRPGRQRALRRLYGSLVRPGDLVFDVGAHLGDRSAAFSALGARVVALEPQPDVRRWLTRLVGTRPGVIIRPEAVGRARGTARLAVSHRTPTVSSLAECWRTALPAANRGFHHVRWRGSVEVDVTTLDALVNEHGTPHFCKIDVEGFEAEVLSGLTWPLPALSVEFVQGALDIAVESVQRLETLGRYEFNAVLGEGRYFLSDPWVGADQMIDWLRRGAAGARSGDVYARIRTRDGDLHRD